MTLNGVILIRSLGCEIEVEGVASVPAFIEEELKSIPGWTEIKSDESILDGHYTAAHLRQIANVMDWHARNEQKPIGIMREAAICADCEKPLHHDSLGAPDGKAYCLSCGMKLQAATV